MFGSAFPGDHHRQTSQLWRGQESRSAASGSAAEPILEQLRGELASADGMWG
jgi:hypothetical protein